MVKIMKIFFLRTKQKDLDNVSIGTESQSEGSILIAQLTAAGIMLMSTVLGLGQSEGSILSLPVLKLIKEIFFLRTSRKTDNVFLGMDS